MDEKIGPYSKDRVVLCSADGGRDSQKLTAGPAGWFYIHGPWVGALRNASERLVHCIN